MFGYYIKFQPKTAGANKHLFNYNNETLIQFKLKFFTIHIFTSAYLSFQQHFRCCCTQIVGPADFRKEINQDRRNGKRMWSKFGCTIIERERMMVVVPSFAEGYVRHKTIFSRFNVPVLNHAISWHFFQILIEILTCHMDDFHKSVQYCSL